MSNPTSSLSLPPIQSLSDPLTFTTTLDLLFEASPELHVLALPIRETPFDSYASLVRHIGLLLTGLVHSPEPAARNILHAILGSHPRLGAKKVDSAQSAAEQAKLQQGGEDEAEKLQKLNDAYEEAFPGLRYVVFVNGRGRPEIMADMQRRIDRGDLRQEEGEAIKAMVDIARDRASKLAGKA